MSWNQTVLPPQPNHPLSWIPSLLSFFHSFTKYLLTASGRLLSSLKLKLSKSRPWAQGVRGRGIQGYFRAIQWEPWRRKE